MNDTVTTALRVLAGDTERLLTDKLRPVGLTVPQMEFLAILDADPTLCGSGAARAAHVSPQTGTTVLQNLAAKKLITVRHYSGNGRRNTITLTAAGRKSLAAAKEAVADVDKRLGALLGSEAVFRISAATPALQPYLPQPKPKQKREAPVGLPQRSTTQADKAGRLRQRCLDWAGTVGGSDTVPGYVALQFGTQAQIDHLVAAGMWKPDGDGYRISD